MFLQGGRAFALKIAHLKDLELRKFAAGLPLRTFEAKAPSTTERTLLECFQKFREQSSPYNEVACLPSDEISVALYLKSLIQGGSPYSSLESACYGINWAHNLYGFQSPCDSKLVKNVLEAAKRGLAKPVSKKEPVTPAMILDICNRFAGPNANLSDLRLATICVTAYTAFLSYNKLARLRCCDVSFCDSLVKIYVYKSKTDVYRDGGQSCWQKQGNLDLSSSLYLIFALCIFIRLLAFTYIETVLQAFVELGYPKNLFGFHSLKAGGASVAAKAGVSDRPFKRRGRWWKTHQAKDGYLKDKLESLLSGYKSLHIQFFLSLSLFSNGGINKRDAPSDSASFQGDQNSNILCNVLLVSQEYVYQVA